MKHLTRLLVVILITGIVTACTKTGGNTGNSNNNSGATIYIGSQNGYTYAIDADSGTQKWMFTSGFQEPCSSVAYANGTVCVTLGSTLYALDAKTGIQKWSFDMPGLGLASGPTVTDNIAYVWGQGTLFAIDISTGTQKWMHPTGVATIGSPIIIDNTIYMFGGVGDLGFAFDATTGTQKWGGQLIAQTSYPNASYILSPVTIVNNTLYLAYSTPTSIAAIDAFDMLTWQRKWECIFGLEIFRQAPVVYNGTLYMSGPLGSLYGIDTASGTVKWKTPQVYLNDTATSIISGVSVNKYARSSSVTGAGSMVYVGANAFDASTGAAKWSSPGGYGIPALFNNTSFVAGSKGDFYALDAITGAKKWAFQTSVTDVLLSKPCVVTADGRVY